MGPLNIWERLCFYRNNCVLRVPLERSSACLYPLKYNDFTAQCAVQDGNVTFDNLEKHDL